MLNQSNINPGTTSAQSLPETPLTHNAKYSAIYASRRHHIISLIVISSAILLYYILFFKYNGMTLDRLIGGLDKLGDYFLRMFVWKNVSQWPFGYYFKQILITLGIVFAGTLTATLLALPLSFLASRRVMSTPVLNLLAIVVRRLFDIMRGIDMAIWGLIFIRAVGMGPLAGVMAIFVQDTGLLGKLYAESHDAVEKRPSRGLSAIGANGLQKHRFGIFTQSFPQFLALTLYQIESNTRSAAVLGFVGAGGIGLVYAENMRLWNWDVVMFITLILVVLVLILDKMSEILRKKYIIGEEVPLYQSETSKSPH
ncbi:phosphonate ABC transporter, permease protein PhnE [Vibrio salinus]|uniref:phosphonate ABC transporter, permease protein PhnE n=1 Tax=Vibrio salinus TaxID=2899784 RepID=UPI001E4F06E5|nr:phosphonate ABC transporter, permease protein PhnE [Vibrio salinus]MCE0495291.1 phosphonate ABC transporter, permease protein PhnE [Vibrio salinus]